jgi:hypothetical protein
MDDSTRMRDRVGRSGSSIRALIEQTTGEAFRREPERVDPAKPSAITLVEPKASESEPARKAEVDDPVRIDPLPKPGDDYKAHARPATGDQPTLFFIPRGFLPDGFSYADFERVRMVPAEKVGGGPVLVVRFNGSVVTDVRIEGRHLHSLCHLIGLRIMQWVWELPAGADFKDDRATVITSITYREVKA